MKIKILFLFFISAFFYNSIAAGTPAEEKIKAFGSFEITKLSKCAFVYTYIMPGEGNYSANGMFYIAKGKALLIDTPGDDNLTDSLITWISNQYKVSIEAIVITHWHMGDRLGGLSAAHKRGIKSYSSELTKAEAKKRNLPVPENSFDKKITINIGGKKVVCEFPGAGHTIDNSIVWFPEDKILFGGCLVKEFRAKNLGYTADSDLKAWPETISKLEKKYSKAKVVVPGHGACAAADITFKNNKELLLKK